VAARGTRHSYVLRDTTTSVAFWLAAALGAVLAGDPLVRGDLGAFARTAPIVAFVVWLLWMLLFHPHLRYDDERVAITNIGRVHVLPWSRVVAVRQKLNLMFELDDGRWIRSTGVTAPRDRGLLLSGLTKGRMGAGSVNYHRNADALTPLREAAAPSDEAVVSRWDAVPLLVGAVLVVAATVDVIVLLLG
jgi:hypothetical protein